MTAQCPEEERPSLPEAIRERLSQALCTLRDIFYGMTLYDWVRELQKARGEVEQAFTLIVFGDLLGIPILTPYYTMRLIPYMVPRLESWKRCMLRERDICELFDQEIG
ncbi:MAG: hypothetical protein N3B68_08825 [Anaerolineae bacterium]|nr:hypothetical protein [Anaerolineae bacterium]